ncbi:MAG: ABC transporter ATP-binding protein [Elusimicrobiales bacterium]
MTEIPAIRLENLAKTYRRSHLGRTTETIALDGLSLAVGRGEIFGLLGLNGAGKTTAMKLVLGLLFPTKGEAEVMGRKAGSNDAKRMIGYLPELPYFYPYFTPAESLEFYAALSGADSAASRISGILERVGLAPHAKKCAGEFSKGMLERLGLAQALVHDPQVLVLDEPVSGLDPLAVWDFRELFLELNRAGKTIFVSSHSISEVEKICSRVAILKAGKLAALVSQQEWKNSPGGLEEIFVRTVRG